jgi:hypothetical protein
MTRKFGPARFLGSASDTTLGQMTRGSMKRAQRTLAAAADGVNARARDRERASR